MSGPRHAACFWMPEHQVVNLFALYASGMPSYLNVPEILGLPEGATVGYVRHDPMRRAFWVVVYHPSFPAWADGADCPQLGRLNAEVHAVAVQRNPSGFDTLLWADHLLAEVKRLRGVFDDLRLDSPPVDAAYERGYEDGKKHQELLRTKQFDGIRAMMEMGVRLRADDVRAAGTFGIPEDDSA